MRAEHLYYFDEELNIVGYYRPTERRIIQDGYICFYDEEPIPVEED